MQGMQKRAVGAGDGTPGSLSTSVQQARDRPPQKKKWADCALGGHLLGSLQPEQPEIPSPPNIEELTRVICVVAATNHSYEYQQCTSPLLRASSAPVGRYGRHSGFEYVRSLWKGELKVWEDRAPDQGHQPNLRHGGCRCATSHSRFRQAALTLDSAQRQYVFLTGCCYCCETNRPTEDNASLLTHCSPLMPNAEADPHLVYSLQVRQQRLAHAIRKL